MKENSNPFGKIVDLQAALKLIVNIGRGIQNARSSASEREKIFRQDNNPSSSPAGGNGISESDSEN